MDIAALKRKEKLRAIDMHNVEGLAQIWYECHIVAKYKHPEVVERVIRRHIKPVIGKLPVEQVRPVHIDDVLTKIVAAGAPTVANDAVPHYNWHRRHSGTGGLAPMSRLPDSTTTS